MKDTIILVDDDLTTLKTGKVILQETYDVFTAPNADALFALLKDIQPTLILLNRDMPHNDGYETLKTLKAMRNANDIPVIFLTDRDNIGDESLGLALGAADYITTPFVPILLKKRIETHILVDRQRRDLEYFNRVLQTAIQGKTQKILNLQNAILTTISDIVESRATSTGGHVERASMGVGILMRELQDRGLYEDTAGGWDINLLVQSSKLHDVGKVSIHDSILQKPDTLSENEFEMMKSHTFLGVKIIEKIQASPEGRDSAARDPKMHDFLAYAKIFAATHHERWDGTGYHAGLKGEEIPLEGRIMAIADVYGALTSPRFYKTTCSHEDAVAIIRRGKGTQFDPNLVDVFVEAQDLFRNLPQE
jgi:putative two-component system response regulator